jgi:hypothetical protein
MVAATNKTVFCGKKKPPNGGFFFYACGIQTADMSAGISREK